MTTGPVAAAAFAIALATSAASQQSGNVLPPLTGWTVQANPGHVATTVTAGEITLRANCNHTASSIAIDIPFTAPQPGAYRLWLDAVWASAPGSREPWTWSIASVGGGTWKQDAGAGSRDVAQWIVRLPAGPNVLTLSTTSFGCGNLGRVWPAELRAVDGPQLVPDLCFVDPNTPGSSNYASFTILNRQPLSNPVYLLFTSRLTRTSPTVWPFGDQWLANPLYLGPLNTASFQPGTAATAGALHGLVYRPAGAPQWWQIVEYDAFQPLTTLRLGSPSRTSAGH